MEDQLHFRASVSIPGSGEHRRRGGKICLGLSCSPLMVVKIDDPEVSIDGIFQADSKRDW